MSELPGVWVHEVAHLLRDHHGRADRLLAAAQRDWHRVNVAQDCEINDDLLCDGLRRPAGWMEPRLLGLPEGQLFEAHLDRLPSEVRGLDCGVGAHGRTAPWELSGSTGPVRLGDIEARALRGQTAEAVKARWRGRGTLPAGWGCWAEEILEPTVAWRQALSGKRPHGPVGLSTTPTAAARAAHRHWAGWSCRACVARCPGWP